MNRVVRVLILTFVLLGISPARGDEWNKSTFVHFDAATRIGGHLLAPGYYQLRLAPSSTNRQILQVFDANTRRLILQLIAISAYRTEVTDKTSITFREGTRGQVRSFDTWYHPGDNFGIEVPEPAPYVPAPTVEFARGAAPVVREGPILHGPSAYPSLKRRRKYALIFAVNKTESKAYDLPIASKDAFDVIRMLVDPDAGRFISDGEYVRLLVGPEATRSAIEEEIRRIGRIAAPQDLVLIVYTSHSISDLRARRRYLATYNAAESDLEHTAFEMQSFTAMVGATIKAQTVVMLDACASGAAQDTRKTVVVAPMPRVALSSNLVVISSSKENEDSWVSSRYQNSYFTKFFVEAMWNTAGKASLTELFTRVSLYLPPAVFSGSGQSQHPVMETNADTDAIFLGEPAEY